MKMLWLSLLTLMMLLTALPLRNPDLPTQWSYATPSKADWEFAEVFIHLNTWSMTPVIQDKMHPARFTGL